ncbi:MAG: hypothetical protein ACI9R3_005428 [Verrucomicrobiales bacterium]|jgi:hypothetical protein
MKKLNAILSLFLFCGAGSTLALAEPPFIELIEIPRNSGVHILLDPTAGKKVATIDGAVSATYLIEDRGVSFAVRNSTGDWLYQDKSSSPPHSTRC